MLSDLFPKACKRFLALPVLGPLAADFEGWLAERGFARATRRQLLRALVRIDRYLQHHGGGLTRAGLEACWRGARRRDATMAGGGRRLGHCLELRGRLPGPAPAPPTPAPACVLAYPPPLPHLPPL